MTAQEIIVALTGLSVMHGSQVEVVMSDGGVQKSVGSVAYIVDAGDNPGGNKVVIELVP